MRTHTSARLALGRVGPGLPSAEVLRFGLAHAQARDAVHRPLDVDALASAVRALGMPVLRARSQAPDRATYLLRPDQGRLLDEASRQELEQAEPAAELAIVAADGLSAVAVQHHVPPLLAELQKVHGTDWTRTPVVIAEQGRVAIGDPIGAALRARMVVVLVGERPGLSSPDSLGVYFTYEPRPGRLDSERNCISNVRPAGLPYVEAAAKLAYLLRKGLRLGFTGVRLKDDSEAAVLSAPGTSSRLGA
ncbi:ethanolamine ammonia-lyase subunit EutC [Verticiella sediminum]